MTISTMALAVALVLAGTPGAAQSTLDRPPDLSGGWVGTPGQLYFHVIHRFEAGPAPSRKVTNTPTLLVAAPITTSTVVGFNYATNSNVARGRPNEWEFFGRWAGLASGPWALAVQGGYNLGAGSVDGEVTLAAETGRIQGFAVGRAFSAWRDTDEARVAAGVGARVALTENIALAGDVVTPLDRGSDESPAWSAGVQFGIPFTPHTLSLHASNAITTTLHGSTVGSGAIRYGFEFTVPVTLRRYFGARSRGAEPAPSMDDDAMGSMEGSAAEAGSAATNDMRGPATPMAADTVEIHIMALAFGTERLEIDPGTTVVWVNADPVAHSATADDGSWDSDLIQPGGRWARTFTAAGEYPYHCTPHPFMQATIVVREGGGGMR